MGPLVANWREVAARALAREAEPAPLATALPRQLLEGLERLHRSPPPARRPVAAWRAVTADALALAQSGWALDALALGWNPLDLFGCSMDGGAAFAGLAVWLEGDRLLLLDGASAIAARGNLRRVFNRRAVIQARPGSGSEVRFLWNMGTGNAR
jgi:hypothetical protein